jgi:streptogramin lyase
VDRVRRAQRRRRVLVPAAATAVAAAAVVTIVSVGSAPSAQATVSAAAAHTGGQSFRVHITEQGRTYDGAFDPAHRTGQLASPVGEDRYIGDTVSTGSARPLRYGRGDRPRGAAGPGTGTPSRSTIGATPRAGC